MNKAELIAKIADDAGVTKTQANATLDSFVDMSRCGLVHWIKWRYGEARTTRSPATPDPVVLHFRTQRIEAQACHVLLFFRQLIAGDLGFHKGVVRHIRVECGNHPVTVSEGIRDKAHPAWNSACRRNSARYPASTGPSVLHTAAMQVSHRLYAQTRRATYPAQKHPPLPARAAGRSGPGINCESAYADRPGRTGASDFSSSFASIKRSRSLWAHFASFTLGGAGWATGRNDQKLRCSEEMTYPGAFAGPAGHTAPALIHAAMLSISWSGSLPPGGILSRACVCRMACISRLPSGSPGLIAGPDFPRVSMCSRVSSCSPPDFVSV